LGAAFFVHELQELYELHELGGLHELYELQELGGVYELNELHENLELSGIVTDFSSSNSRNTVLL
jgi:hypothetical protein